VTLTGNSHLHLIAPAQSSLEYYLAMRSVAFLCLLMAVSSMASADDAGQARGHFVRGKTLYDVGRFAEAAKEFEAAYEAKNDPAILFNLAQSYRFAHDYEKAIVTYRAFLRNAPDDHNRAQVEKSIADLQERLNREQPARPPQRRETAPPAAVTPPPTVTPAITPATTQAPPPRAKRSWVLVGVGAGLLGLGAAGIAVGAYDLAINGNGTCARAPGQLRCPDRYNTAGVGGAFVGLGAAAAITGAALLIVDARRVRRLHAALGVTPASTALVLGGEF
jgi:tetratricopeptide (TPR) repeat protein